MRKPLLICLLLCSRMYSFGQISEGCVFLQGDYVEVGIAPNGAFGTPANAPGGYHPRPLPLSNSLFNPVTGVQAPRNQAIGFVADYGKDGWLTGTPGYFGDYFMPGTVQEGFSIEINGTKADAWSNSYQTNGSSGFNGLMTGTNTDYQVTPNGVKGIWEGNMMNLLSIRQVITLKQNKAYFTATVVLRNKHTDTLRNIYYMRTLDPDNEVSVSNLYATRNNIAYQLPNLYNKTLVTAIGPTYPASYLGLGTKDCQARCFIVNAGLFPNGRLADIYRGSTSFLYRDSLNADVGIGLVFNIGNLAPGDSTAFSYAYILNEADLDDAFSETEPGFMYNGSFYPSGSVIVQPTGSVLPIDIVNGDYYNWSWSPGTFLDTTRGTHVNDTVSTGPVTYTIIGVGTEAVANRCSNKRISITVSPVPVSPPPTPIADTLYYCVGDIAAPLYATGAGTIKWYLTPAGGLPLPAPPVPSTAAPGVFRWYVSQEISGIESIRVPVTVIIRTPPVVTISPASPSICAGDTVMLRASAAFASDFSWTPAGFLTNNTGNTTSAFPNSTQTYTVRVIDTAGCKSNQNVTVAVRPLPVVSITPSDGAVCPGDSVQLTANAAAGITYQWNASPSLNTTSGATVIAFPRVPTRYTVTATDATGCAGKTSVSVAIHPVPIPNLGADRSICKESEELLSPGSFASYEWQDRSTASFFSTDRPGTYWVTVTSDKGCIASDTVRILSLLDLPSSFLDDEISFCRGSQVVIKVPGYSGYLWGNGNTSESNTVETFGWMSLTVTDRNGCKGTDSILLIDKHCIPYAIPNAFTPNKDGKNESFRPLISQNVKNYSMKIFKRGGELLFIGRDPNRGWDGTYKGQAQDNAVYVYLIEFIDYDKTPVTLKGTFVLIR